MIHICTFCLIFVHGLNCYFIGSFIISSEQSPYHTHTHTLIPRRMYSKQCQLPMVSAFSVKKIHYLIVKYPKIRFVNGNEKTTIAEKLLCLLNDIQYKMIRITNSFKQFLKFILFIPSANICHPLQSTPFLCSFLTFSIRGLFSVSFI